MCEAAPALPCLRCVVKDYTNSKQAYEDAVTVYRQEVARYGQAHERAVKAAEVVKRKKPIFEKHKHDMTMRALHAPSQRYHEEHRAALLQNNHQLDNEGQSLLDPKTGKKLPAEFRAHLHPVHHSDVIAILDRLETARRVADEFKQIATPAEYEAMQREAQLAGYVETFFTRVEQRAAQGNPPALPDRNEDVLAMFAYMDKKVRRHPRTGEKLPRVAPKVPADPNDDKYAVQVEKLRKHEEKQVLLASIREVAEAEAKARLAAGEELTAHAQQRRDADAKLRKANEEAKVASEAAKKRRAEEAARTGKKPKPVEPTTRADHDRMGEQMKADKRRAAEAEQQAKLLEVKPVIPSALMATTKVETAPTVEPAEVAEISVVEVEEQKVTPVAQKAPVTLPVAVDAPAPAVVASPPAEPLTAGVVPALPPIPGTPEQKPAVVTRQGLPVVPPTVVVPPREPAELPPVLEAPQVPSTSTAAAPEEQHSTTFTKLLRLLGMK